MDKTQLNTNSDFATLHRALHGRCVLVEFREGCRWHHRGIAECRVSQSNATESPLVELVIPQPYRAAELAQGPHVLRVPPERFAHFQPSAGIADYQFLGVLYDNDDVDESTRIADKPFVIVSPDQLSD